MRSIIQQIRESLNLNKINFAALLGVSPAAITRWESGERTPTGHEEIGALLRVAQPEQQAALLEALGIEDVEQFAADLLASAGDGDKADRVTGRANTVIQPTGR